MTCTELKFLRIKLTDTHDQKHPELSFIQERFSQASHSMAICLFIF